METEPHEASWAERCSPSSRGEDQAGRGDDTASRREGPASGEGLASFGEGTGSPMVGSTSTRGDTPDSPPVQADPLTCESIGSCDIIDMPNTDDIKKEVIPIDIGWCTVGLCGSQQLQCVCELQPAFTPRPLAYKQEM